MIYIERTEVSLDQAPMVLFDNILLDGTVTPASIYSVLGFEADFVLDFVGDTYLTEGEYVPDPNVQNTLTDSTFDFWNPTSPSGALYLSLPTNGTASALGISGHNLGTQGATVKVFQGSTVLAEVSPTDDSTMIILFASTTATDFTIVVSGAAGVTYISNLVLGVPLVFESGILPGYTPLWMAEDVELLQNTSLGGQFFQNRVVRKSANTSVNLNILDREFVEGTNFQSFRRHFNDGKTFFFAAGPSVFEDDGSFCRRSGDTLKPTFSNNGIFYQVGMQLEAYIG